ncbi:MULTISPECIES: DUF4382 domain-containing protein [unclassified Imperialibacter]|uniref:DUF4382 domain-containing protein n=1 Tax=unclassified Imperialibacter TaxID=2629706 RepID=UPI00125ACC4C|nr:MULTISPECIES: DUF4382 domain-containing protein [unclassified Imperialibacter]CAD5264268.1 conserved hypothetical protein [Imperialibacter sp. 89]CAD5280348.1 conserved hypothetical protein [Imperialibacter sp. 75]VVT31687.1 conserved hypothetical protein [Imperialibacter sp. EC-SDR9]
MQRQITFLKQSFLLISLVILAISCQEPSEDITGPDKEMAFTKGSALGQLLQKMSLKDGSDDNVIDNASCLTLVLPVKGSFRGKAFTVSKEADLAVLQDIYYLNPYQSDRFLLDFPLRVIKSDHTEVAVSSQEELDVLAALCVANGLDDDIECVDIEYPISMATYDLQNQIADIRTVADDASLFHLFNEFNDDDLLSIQFPIHVATSMEAQVIEGNTALQNAFDAAQDTCDEGDRVFYNAGLPLATGKLELLLTDAPFPIDLIEEANVTILKIEVKTGVANDTIPFVTVFNEPTTFNLLDLSNGITARLSETALPVGSYSFFSVYVTDGSVLLKDGQLFDLNIPSGDKNGIKVKPPFDIEIKEGESASYLLDFDVSSSFVVRGNPNTPAGINGFNFKPVIRAADQFATGTLSGTISDTGGLLLSGAQITLFAADTLHTTALSGEDGEFTILGLAPGDYQVQAELTDYETSTLENLFIEKGKETTVNIDLTNN